MALTWYLSTFRTTMPLTTNTTNDSVDHVHDKWAPFVLELIILWFDMILIAEFIRLPKFIYVNTSLIIIIFIICSIFVDGSESDDHDALDFVRLVMLPGRLIISLLARVNVISKNESISPYFESIHFWLIWISDKIFGGTCGEKGVSWFCHIVTFANVFISAIDELLGNKLYICNAISGFMVALCLPMPLCYDTNEAVAKVHGTPSHDLSWNLHIGWVTLYTLWRLSYTIYALGVDYAHFVVLSVAYVRALIFCRNDLWFHTRIVTVSLIIYLQMPISFYFDRWWFYYKPSQVDDSQILAVFEWIAFANMIYGALYMLYALYSVTESVQDESGDLEESDLLTNTN